MAQHSNYAKDRDLMMEAYGTVQGMSKQFSNIDDQGTKRYYSDHEMTILHREDGPAVEYIGGEKLWYIDNEFLTEDEFNSLGYPRASSERSGD